MASGRHVRRAVAVSLSLHFSVAGFLVFLGIEGHRSPPEEAVFHLADYDPLGGSPGGSGWGLPETESWAPPPEPEPHLEPEPETEPEPPPLLDFELVSASEAGEEINLPPPEPEKPKPKPNPKPKPETPRNAEPARETAAAQPDTVRASGGPPAPAAGQRAGAGDSGPSGGPGSGRGGTGGGSGRGGRGILDAYVSKVRNRMDRNKKYPARGRDLTGKVDVNFTVKADGSVSGARIVASSGHDLLDDEVMALVRRVAPFAPIPAELGRDSINITVPVVFAGAR
jgi:protein TonB